MRFQGHADGWHEISGACQPSIFIVTSCSRVLAAEYIMAGEIVIEYTGELVRRPVADARERDYAAAGSGMLPRGSCYMFAIDVVRLRLACCRVCWRVCNKALVLLDMPAMSEFYGLHAQNDPLVILLTYSEVGFYLFVACSRSQLAADLDPGVQRSKFLHALPFALH